MSTLPNKVRQFLTAIPIRRSRVLLAVSGGADSIALVRAFELLQAEWQLPHIGIAHLNHQLRGQESDDDESFVRQLYQQMDSQVPGVWHCYSHRVDVQSLAEKNRQGVEATAREVRYQWFRELACEHDFFWVVTGHTADDQAETVLHRLVRGTGIHGLSGIPQRRPLTEGVEVVRPLLTVSRSEVLSFLTGLGQPFREDSSNALPQYTRNRIRQDLLPKLVAEYNPAIVEVLGRLAQQAGDMQILQAELGRDLLQQCELPRAGTMCILALSELQSAHRHLIREAFKQLWQREAWPIDEMGFREWERAVDVVNQQVTAVDFPGPVRMRRSGKVIQVGPVDHPHRNPCR